VAQVIYSAEALADLERTIEFLLAAAPQSASTALGQITSAMKILESHPRIGRRIAKNLRELVITHGSAGYLALYRHEAARDVVRVLRIRHQREAGYQD
jgi:plasmid stabilization system protein ParE